MKCFSFRRASQYHYTEISFLFSSSGDRDPMKRVLGPQVMALYPAQRLRREIMRGCRRDQLEVSSRVLWSSALELCSVSKGLHWSVFIMTSCLLWDFRLASSKDISPTGQLPALGLPPRTDYWTSNQAPATS